MSSLGGNIEEILFSSISQYQTNFQLKVCVVSTSKMLAIKYENRCDCFLQFHMIAAK